MLAVLMKTKQRNIYISQAKFSSIMLVMKICYVKIENFYGQKKVHSLLFLYYELLVP